VGARSLHLRNEGSHGFLPKLSVALGEELQAHPCLLIEGVGLARRRTTGLDRASDVPDLPALGDEIGHDTERCDQALSVLRTECTGQGDARLARFLELALNSLIASAA